MGPEDSRLDCSRLIEDLGLTGRLEKFRTPFRDAICTSLEAHTINIACVEQHAILDAPLTFGKMGSLSGGQTKVQRKFPYPPPAVQNGAHDTAYSSGFLQEPPFADAPPMCSQQHTTDKQIESCKVTGSCWSCPTRPQASGFKLQWSFGWHPCSSRLASL